MIGRRISRWVAGLLVVAAALIAGCETGFITEAARASLASFITGAVNGAVAETIGP